MASNDWVVGTSTTEQCADIMNNERVGKDTATTLTSDNIIVGNGGKDIKDSGKKLTDYIEQIEKGNNGGIATLNTSGNVEQDNYLLIPSRGGMSRSGGGVSCVDADVEYPLEGHTINALSALFSLQNNDAELRCDNPLSFVYNFIGGYRLNPSNTNATLTIRLYKNTTLISSSSYDFSQLINNRPGVTKPTFIEMIQNDYIKVTISSSLANNLVNFDHWVTLSKSL